MFQHFPLKILTLNFVDNTIARKINTNKLIILGLPTKLTKLIVDNSCSVEVRLYVHKKAPIMINMSEQHNLTFTCTHLCT